MSQSLIMDSGILIAAAYLFANAYMQIFANFQYLYYRDENKAEMAKMKKAFAEMG